MSRLKVLVVVIRPEFSDFVAPVVKTLLLRGHEVRVMTPDGAAALPADDRPDLVIFGNEHQVAGRFRDSITALLPHSVFLRDTIPTRSAQQNAYEFLDFDAYFCPSVFYREWMTRALVDAYHLPPKVKTDGLKSRLLIPGGYAKELRRNAPAERAADEDPTPLILYAPSGQSPEHDSHNFHTHGVGIVATLLAASPTAHVVVRPHPTDAQRTSVMQLQRLFEREPRVTLDLEPTPASASYSQPDLLVTDMSGFAFTYAIRTGRRPVFYIEEETAKRHPRFTALAMRYGYVAPSFDHLGLLARAVAGNGPKMSDAMRSELEASCFVDRSGPEAVADDLEKLAAGERGPGWWDIPGPRRAA